MTEQSKPGPSHARQRAVLYIMTFIMGGCGIAYEYTFSKIGSDLLGNSVRQWAITIGLMMFFMGIGSDVQKYLKDRHIFDKFIFFEILLGLLGGFGPILMVWLFGYAREHYVLVQYSLITTTGFLIGLEIPILARINEQFTKDLRVNIGGVLRMDYIGGFIGAVLWAYVFIVILDLTRVGFVLGLFNVVTAGVSLYYFRGLAHRKMALSLFTFVSGVALSIGLYQAPAWTAYAEQKLYMDKVVFSDSTKYQHIVLTRSSSGDIFCYINGNTQFSSYDEHIYHEFLVHPAMMAAPRHDKVLVLGGGDGLAVREILKYPDVKEITLVDLDPGMTKLARDNPYLSKMNEGALEDSRLKVIENGALVDAGEQDVATPDRTALFGGKPEVTAKVQIVNLDASIFVDQIRGTYDIIIIDFPDPSNLELSKLYSKSFFTRLRAKLSRDGILVQQSTSPVHSKEAFLCIGRTMEDSGFNALPFHENVPVFGEWGWWIAGRDDAWNAEKFQQFFAGKPEIPVPVKHLTPDLVQASFAFGKDSLTTSQTKVNTILNNVIYLYYSDALSAGY